MAVQVLIKRKFIKEKAGEVAPLMVKLRSIARGKPGYISSESLKCIDPPHEDEYLIRSSWQSEEDWKKWLNSEERGAIQQQIDSITGEKTEYRTYEPLVGGIFPKMSE
ncbi:MAG: antibiotic biosynthesis monooxygenase [Deltaproteobacteria bacterium]|nr:antibiotic biosynthesis monooxygenase [Deltaproteobacteria bacterium]